MKLSREDIIRAITVAIIIAIMMAGCDWEFPSGYDGGTPPSGDDWFVSGVGIQRDGLNYAEVYGVVTMRDRFSFAPTASVRYYSDDYYTLIVEANRTIGGDLENVGDVQLFDITHYQVYVVPATGGYDRVCATLEVEDSNYAGAVLVGCLE